MRSMKIGKYVILLIFACLGGVTFAGVGNTKTILVELVKPPQYTFLKGAKHVVILDCLPACENTEYNRPAVNLEMDTTLDNKILKVECINELADFLTKRGDFASLSVLDSIRDRKINDTLARPTLDELFNSIDADVCISLNSLSFERKAFHFYDGTYRIRAATLWAIVSKDSIRRAYISKVDTLFLSKTQYSQIAVGKKNRIGIFRDASKYLGRSFGSKLIQGFSSEERMYYHSHNPEMLRAENLALNNDWHRAAWIWNTLTKNKNQKIAAKAQFNMALACEMEGKPDLAINWILESGGKYDEKEKVPNIRYHCKNYLQTIYRRINEIGYLKR